MDDDFDVEGPLDKEVKEAAERRSPLAQRIASMTAVLSTVRAVVNHASGNARNEALLLKNESILLQSQASDQWAHYRSKSTKLHIAGAAAKLIADPVVRQDFIAERDREDAGRLAVEREAQRLQDESRRLARESDIRLRPHEYRARALSFLQIGIALAAADVGRGGGSGDRHCGFPYRLPSLTVGAPATTITKFHFAAPGDFKDGPAHEYGKIMRVSSAR